MLMFALVVSLSVKPDLRDKFLTAAEDDSISSVRDEPGCLRFYENERAVRTASSEQVRRPIFREGVDHWRHYEPWLGTLKGALGPVLDCYPEVPDFV